MLVGMMGCVIAVMKKHVHEEGQEALMVNPKCDPY